MFNIKLGLSQISELLNLLENPQNDLKFIHLAGTNGKGSTGAMLTATLQSVGFKVGMYSSPHLISINERFTINNQQISEENLINIVAELKIAIDSMHKKNVFPTFFEVTTAIAILYFYQQKTDFVVLETGMGGRFDATNIVNPICSIITSIALDHSEYLGDTVEKIAYEKAGIIKEKTPIFTADLQEKTFNVIKDQALLRKSKIKKVSIEYDISKTEIIKENKKYSQRFSIKDTPITLSLNGTMQLENTKLVFMVLEYLAVKYDFNFNQALLGLNNVKWQGRFQILTNGNVIDGAHNVESAKSLIQSLNEYFPNEKFLFFFANFADKKTKDILNILSDKADTFIFFTLSTKHRKSATPKDLQKILKNIDSNKNSIIATSLEDALKKCKYKNRKVFTGSLYLAGEIIHLTSVRTEKASF